MLIQMLTTSAGPDGVRLAGSVHDVPSKDAQALIDGGYAVSFKREEPIEKAVAVRGKAKAKDAEE